MILEVEFYEGNETVIGKFRCKRIEFPDDWRNRDPVWLKGMIALELGKKHQIKSIKVWKEVKKDEKKAPA